MSAWDLQVARDDLTKTRLLDVDESSAGAGEAVLKVDRVGLTANNVTYAVLGDSLSYWKFFPAEEGWGHVPLWGFADVVDSRVDGVEVGSTAGHGDGGGALDVAGAGLSHGGAGDLGLDGQVKFPKAPDQDG